MSTQTNSLVVSANFRSRLGLLQLYCLIGILEAAKYDTQRVVVVLMFFSETVSYLMCLVLGCTEYCSNLILRQRKPTEMKFLSNVQ